VESSIKRAGLEQTLALIAQVREARTLAELDLHLHRSSWTAVIADARAVPSLLAMSSMQSIPIVVLAVDSVDARTIDTVSVAAVLVEYDPALSTRLRDVLTALAAGERPEPLMLPDEPDPDERHVAPPRIVQLFHCSGFTRRELDVIWLEYQGLSSKEIARRLGIAELTIGSRWRTIAAKLHLSRPEAEAWTRTRIAESNRQRDADEPQE
jgi:DNA-binding NarL/FixJ family response regulator